MLNDIITKALNQIAVVEVFLKWIDIISNPYAIGSSEKNAIDTLNFPRADIQEEHLLRHNSVIGRLYNIFENFVESSLTIWISKIPSYFLFEQLTENLQNKYRAGLSKIIRDIKYRRFSHLDLESVLQKYLKSLNGDKDWSFVNEALIYHENNLRRNEIENLFNAAGFENFWSKLEENRKIKEFEDFLGERVLLQKKLEDFINYRNDSAHSVPDEILGPNKLREWIAFIKAMCQAIEEVVNHEILKRELTINPVIKIGDVVERYRDNVYVCTFDRCWLQKGQTLVFYTESACIKSKVESLQLNSVNFTGMWVSHNDIEVGIKIGDRVSRKSKVISLEKVNRV